MGHQSEVANADESRRQNMQEESAQELVDRQRHQALLVLVGGIAPAKSDHAIGQSDEPMVGDRHTMGVLTEITKRVLRTAEGSLRVHNPFGAEQRAEPRREGLRFPKRGECAVEGEFVLRMQRFQAVHELSPEHFFEDLNRQEELLLRVDPAGVIRSQTSGGSHAMNVRMKQQPLTVP
jgi:hypothetical protein